MTGGQTDWLAAVVARPLASFGVLLAVLLVAVGLGWGAAGWLRRPDPPLATAPSPGRLLPRLAIGFAAILAMAAVFAELAVRLGAGPTMASADQSLSDAIARSLSPAARRGFELLTHLGDPLTLLGIGVVVTAALLCVRRPGLALAWVAAVSGNALLNPLLKRLFERLRPLHEGLPAAAGFSFPSGHSSGSVVVYGMLAYLAMRLLPREWHLPALWLAAATAFTVGSSRVMIGVHFPSDVLAGFASGGAWLTVCILSAELGRRFSRFSRR
jgi:membrane-associated phospholipid phosphatase